MKLKGNLLNMKKSNITQRGICFSLVVLLCGINSISLGQRKAFTNDDILRLAKAGFSEETIIESIRTNEPRYDTSAEALVALKNAGISERIITAMLAAARPKTIPLQTDSGGRTLPNEIGVYVLKEGQYVELAVEAVEWKSKFFFPTTTVGSLTKSRLAAQLKSPQSALQLSGDEEFLVVCPEGVSATQYHLLRAEPNKDKREFRVDFQVLNNGVLLALGGAGKSAMRFDAEKISPGKFRVLLRELEKGEYAFLPPGTTSHSGTSSVDKMYTFGMR